MAFEAGVLDVAPETSCMLKGRLQPGRMFLVDTEQGRIVDDEEIKQRVATEQTVSAVARPSTWSTSNDLPAPRLMRRHPITTRC